VTERARREYAAVLRPRYQIVDKRDRGRILDEYCRTTGSHRKAAIRRLRGGPHRTGVFAPARGPSQASPHAEQSHSLDSTFSAATPQVSQQRYGEKRERRRPLSSGADKRLCASFYGLAGEGSNAVCSCQRRLLPRGVRPEMGQDSPVICAT